MLHLFWLCACSCSLLCFGVCLCSVVMLFIVCVCARLLVCVVSAVGFLDFFLLGVGC